MDKGRGGGRGGTVRVPREHRRHGAAILEQLADDGLQGVGRFEAHQVLGGLPVCGALLPHVADGVRVHLRLAHRVGPAGHAAGDRSSFREATS